MKPHFICQNLTDCRSYVRCSEPQRAWNTAQHIFALLWSTWSSCWVPNRFRPGPPGLSQPIPSYAVPIGETEHHMRRPWATRILAGTTRHHVLLSIPFREFLIIAAEGAKIPPDRHFVAGKAGLSPSDTPLMALPPLLLTFEVAMRSTFSRKASPAQSILPYLYNMFPSLAAW
jgi:hypothetical protein